MNVRVYLKNYCRPGKVLQQYQKHIPTDTSEFQLFLVINAALATAQFGLLYESFCFPVLKTRKRQAINIFLQMTALAKRELADKYMWSWPSPICPTFYNLFPEGTGHPCNVPQQHRRDVWPGTDCVCLDTSSPSLTWPSQTQWLLGNTSKPQSSPISSHPQGLPNAGAALTGIGCWITFSYWMGSGLSTNGPNLNVF